MGDEGLAASARSASYQLEMRLGMSWSELQTLESARTALAASRTGLARTDIFMIILQITVKYSRINMAQCSK
jgi:hypothetical protein